MHSHFFKTSLKQGNESLNPCCNGRCTRTEQIVDITKAYNGSLNPCCNGRCTRTTARIVTRVRDSIVLILVVMEDALALCNKKKKKYF